MKKARRKTPDRDHVWDERGRHGRRNQPYRRQKRGRWLADEADEATR